MRSRTRRPAAGDNGRTSVRKGAPVEWQRSSPTAISRFDCQTARRPTALRCYSPVATIPTRRPVTVILLATATDECCVTDVYSGKTTRYGLSDVGPRGNIWIDVDSKVTNRRGWRHNLCRLLDAHQRFSLFSVLNSTASTQRRRRLLKLDSYCRSAGTVRPLDIAVFGCLGFLAASRGNIATVFHGWQANVVGWLNSRNMAK